MKKNTLGQAESMRESGINPTLNTHGSCCVCGNPATFVADVSEWGSVRESMHCTVCQSSSRKRHVVKILLDLYAPSARFLYEAKPALSAFSIYSAVSNDHLHLSLGAENPNYVCSEYFPEVEEGKEKDGVVCQNLERLTFSDQQFDMVITEDVFEHIRKPEKAFAEIHRVLKQDGRHIFTIPFMFDRKTLRRVNTDTGEDVHVMPPDYHLDTLRNRILVYTDFGYDLFDLLNALGFQTEVSFFQHRDAMTLGIADSYVFISRKI
jgi:SAM-dependent methyltransferase